MQLRLTRRALTDLGLAIEDYARRPADDYVEANEVVRVFVERRGQDPIGQEWTNLPVTAAPVYNLHYGRWRALTWHDETSEVVWLLGVGWHESGSRSDAYVVLKARDESGTLMPDEADYLDLEMSLEETRSFVAEVAQQAPTLVGRARQNPGEEVRGVLAGRLGVGVVVEVLVIEGDDEKLEDVYVGFALPPMHGPVALPPQGEWIMVVLAAMVPVTLSAKDLDYGATFPRVGGSRPNEIVVRWRSS